MLPPDEAAATLSVVMPVYNARSYLESSLPALLRIDDPRLLEVIVVDDGSTDGSGEFAAGLGLHVLDSGGRLGPAAARNVGVRAARGDVILFVDSDVVLHADSFSQVADSFCDPETTALFGAYDDEPHDRGFMSQYMNLRHHHGHQIPSDDATTFWAGLGALRREAFLEVGGFDAERFPMPSIEDIELGYRLRAAGGRIRRDPTIQATHLKRWSLVEVVRTDFLRRAIPWSQLMLEHPGAFTDLNLGSAERGKAVVAGALALATLLALAGVLSPWLPVAILALAALLNRPLLTVFARSNGWWFALRALLFQQLYFLYSGLAYLYCVARQTFSRSDGTGRG